MFSSRKSLILEAATCSAPWRTLGENLGAMDFAYVMIVKLAFSVDGSETVAVACKLNG